MTGAADMEALFRPSSIAVVGASAGAGKAGNAMVRSLLGFPGRLHLVNPRGGEIEGRTAVPSLAAIGEPVDLAVLVVRAGAVPAALEECGRAGVRAAIVCAGGFAEADRHHIPWPAADGAGGGEGRSLQDEALAVARRYGMRLLGPNTSGYMNPLDGALPNFVPDVTTLEPGPVAMVASSGGVNLAACFAAAADGLGVRLGVGLGNAADVGFADVLAWLAGDEATRAVGVQLEGVDDGRGLVAAVAELAAVKPVVALKVGRTDVSAFARSHTGRVLGHFELSRAALRQAGAVVVDDLGELVDALRVLCGSRLPPLADPGVGIVTGQAGPGLLIADELRGRGVSVPELDETTVKGLGRLLPPLTWQRNPVDTGRPQDTFAAVLAEVAADPGVDALLVYALEEGDAVDPEVALRTPGVAGELPVVFGSSGPAGTLDRRQRALARLAVPLYRTPERAARAMGALVEDGRARHRLATVQGRPASPLPPTVAGLLGGAAGPPDEHTAKEVLDALGVPTPERRVCAGRAAAHAALAELGAPVVVKLLDPEVPHKRAAGGVHLGVHTGDELDAALDAIDAAAGGAPRYLVEAEAGRGPELLVGGFRDPAFGPVVALGPGGSDVERLGGPALRLAPLGLSDVDEMVAGLDPALVGDQGPALCTILLAVSDLMMGAPQVAEVDLNPVRLTRSGPWALDALVVLG
ncbi:MAG TPA: acetate--CoA ligase family protein [Acidimicrobiales bacterium]